MKARSPSVDRRVIENASGRTAQVDEMELVTRTTADKSGPNLIPPESVMTS